MTILKTITDLAAATEADALRAALKAIIEMSDEIASAPATAIRWAERIEDLARAALEETKP